MSLFQKHSLEGYLTGQLLVAMPQMKDPRFTHAVVYICGHDEHGAMGLIINKMIDKVNLSDLLKQMSMKTSSNSAEIPIYYGGPLDMGRGFVLHSDDYKHENSINVSDGIALSATLDILTLIADNSGPQHQLCLLGYAGWNAGQLESELQQNSWLQITAHRDIIFSNTIEDKWRQAIQSIGFSPEDLALDAGHA